jgi:hypothetical protein
MAHVHDADNDAYYLDQLCLIGICAAFAGVCLSLYFWQTEMLALLLAPQFHLFVLLSGVGLLGLVVVRSVTLWRQAGARAQMAGHDHHHHHDHDHEHCGHDHSHEHHITADPHTAGAADFRPGSSHGHEHHITADPHGHTHAAAPHGHVHHHHDHDHDHGHAHGHDHDHGHDHSWAPWRYVVLLIPIMLFLLGLPNRGLTVQAAHLDTTREAAGWAGLVALGPSSLQQAAALAALEIDPGATQLKIVLDNRSAELAELKPGMPVVVKRTISRKYLEPYVEEVRAGEEAAKAAEAAPADPLTVVGKVAAVNLADKELEVVWRHNGKEEKKTFDLGLGPIYQTDFKALEALAFNPLTQKEWKGLTVRAWAQIAPVNDRHFTLVRYRIQCCGADAVAVKIPVVLSRGSLFEVPDRPRHDDWVKVTGRIDFREQIGQAGKRTMLVVSRPKDIQKATRDPNPYIP